MPHLPDVITALLPPFAVCFDPRTWRKAQVLRIGAVLTPRKRTVSSALHVLELHERPDFTRCHQVLNRAVGSPLTVSRGLLYLRLPHRVADHGRVWLGIDETVEQRGGPRIAAKGGLPGRGAFLPRALRQGHGLARDPSEAVGIPALDAAGLGSALSHRVGPLRALSRGAGPSPPDAHRLGPADAVRCPALPWLAACQALTPAVTFLTRLRRDAALYAPALPPTPGPRGRPRLKGHRLSSLRTILTDPATRWPPSP